MSIFLNVFRSLLPLLITSVLNIIIFRIINNRIRPSESSDTHNKAFIQNTKAARTVGLILLSLVIAFVPLRIITILGACGKIEGIYESLSPFIVTTKLLNSLVNPLIYAVTTEKFKASFWKTIKDSTTSSSSKRTSSSLSGIG